MLKKLLITFQFLITFIGFAQTNQSIISKRIEIVNPSHTDLLKVKDAGIDLTCGGLFRGNDLLLELGESELKELDRRKISYRVLIEDLIPYYKEKFEVELPKAIEELNQLKSNKSLKSKSQILKSETVDNFVQYEGCSEFDWAVPNNFVLGSMGGCLTVDETMAQLDLMRTLYPNLISVRMDVSPTNQKTHGNAYTNNGQYDSWAGQTIYYVRISDNPDVDEPNEPESLFSGMIHSRESSSLMNLMYFMWYILENYDTDPGIKNLIDNQELYFIPVANPDGLKWNEQIAPSGGGLQRKNLGPYNTGNNYTRGVDLNRNFDYFWGPNAIYGGSSGTTTEQTYRGPSAASEPEVQIIADFSASRNFKTAMNHHSFSNLIPHAYNGYPAAPPSGRESEYHKFCHDMTRFNRYVYGEAPDVLTIANGDMSDWLLGGVADVNGSTGSGKQVLALAPENGSYLTIDGEGEFWPNPTKIVEIAKRAMRMNFMNAYYSGKFAQLHDLNTTNITSTSGNFQFGIEYIGQTIGDITLSVTPVSSNILSLTLPATQTGWSKLEQRTLNVPYTLDSGVQNNDPVEFQVTLSNDDGYVLYQANIVKYFNPQVLTLDNPDVDGITNWTSSGGSWGTTSDAYSGTTAITDSPSGSYSNNLSKTLTNNATVDLSTGTAFVVQFYAKWDLERNFDYVQIQGSVDGSNWINLCGKYTKPGSDDSTNRYSDAFSTNTSDGSRTTADRSNQPTGQPIYDGDTMDKWVMEEIYIDATSNNSLFGQSSVRFRFLLDSDSTNRADGYPTTFDGFIFDDFKIIKIQEPCVLSVPVNVAVSGINTDAAVISWDAVTSASYDLQYRVVGATTWIDVADLVSNTYNLTGLAASTQYEVRVRAKCDASTSNYSSSSLFTTTSITYCISSGTTSSTGITNVKFNTISNSDSDNTNSGYEDFTAISTDLDLGKSYTLSGSINTNGNGRDIYVIAWIDFNRDGDFSDSGETFNLGKIKNGSTFNTTVISVPTNSILGESRMRISAKYNSLPTSCETGFDGEVEDYTINIIDSTLGIQDEILSAFNLYPNPVSNGKLAITVPNEIDVFTVTIASITGQQLFTTTLQNNAEIAHQITVPNLKTGIYFVTVSTNLGKASKKLIVQ